MKVPVLLSIALLGSLAGAQEFTPASKDPAVLKRLEKEWTTAQDAFAKHPNDRNVRDRYVVAGVRYGYESMYSPLLPPKIKYRQALRLYTKVLAVDPHNKEARKDSDMIISVYKSMGRPIPK